MSTVSRAPGWRPAPQSEFVAGRVESGRYIPPIAKPAGGAVIADVTIDDSYVYTPIGAMRRDQTRWTIGQTVPGPNRLPSWAMVCAIFLFLVMGPFSLLFLLASEHDGEMTTVQISDGRLTYVMHAYTYSREQYLAILKTAEWSERALPGRAEN
jgi:hypothetical protein